MSTYISNLFSERRTKSTANSRTSARHGCSVWDAAENENKDQPDDAAVNLSHGETFKNSNDSDVSDDGVQIR